MSRLWLTLFIASLVWLPSAGSEARSQATIEVTAQAERFKTAAPPVGRAGDGERLTWRLNDRFGRPVGIGLLNCRWQLRQARLCTGELRFPLGKLAVVGSSPTRSLGEWAVVGGTGKYLGASGVLEFRAIGLRRLTLIITI